MTLQHLIAIICYTDFTDLCTEWSSTFRPKYFGESIISIKKRNQKFYHLSKLLMVVVQYFGTQCMSVHVEKGKKKYKYKNMENLSTSYTYITYNEENGPFYCGMSFIMPLSSFNTCLHSPTSTSTHIEVAIKFAKQQGIIIQFNNNGVNINKRTAFFDTSWISTYPEEDERYDHDISYFVIFNLYFFISRLFLVVN